MLAYVCVRVCVRVRMRVCVCGWVCARNLGLHTDETRRLAQRQNGPRERSAIQDAGVETCGERSPVPSHVGRLVVSFVCVLMCVLIQRTACRAALARGKWGRRVRVRPL